MILTRAISVILLIVTAGSVVAESPTSKSAMIEPDVQRGFAFAKNNCAKCHAIGRSGESPLRDAPPFRELKLRYPVEDLAEPFSEGIMTGHPTMPVWRLEPDQIQDLIAYLKTL